MDIATIVENADKNFFIIYAWYKWNTHTLAYRLIGRKIIKIMDPLVLIINLMIFLLFHLNIPVFYKWKEKKKEGDKEKMKHILSCLKGLWLCRSQQTVENSSRDGNTRPPDLPPEKSVCRTRSNSKNWSWNNRLVANWEGVHQGCILSPCLFNLYTEQIMQNARLDEAQAGIKTAGRNINNLK